MAWDFNLQNKEVPLLRSESWVTFLILKTEQPPLIPQRMHLEHIFLLTSENSWLWSMKKKCLTDWYYILDSYVNNKGVPRNHLLNCNVIKICRGLFWALLFKETQPSHWGRGMEKTQRNDWESIQERLLCLLGERASTQVLSPGSSKHVWIIAFQRPIFPL